MPAAYARVITVPLHLDMLDQAIDWYRNGIVPAARDVTGACGTFLLIDHTSGKGLSCSLWDDEESLRQSEASTYFRDHLRPFEPMLAGAFSMARYAVLTLQAAPAAPEAARLVTFQVRPELVEQADALYRDQIIPAARQVRGFHGVLFAADVLTGRGIVISTWESHAALRASEASGYFEAQMAKARSFHVVPPVVEVFTVEVWADIVADRTP